MLPGLSLWPFSFLRLQFTEADIRPQVKWAVNLEIADDHFNLPQAFVWVWWVTSNIVTLLPQSVHTFMIISANEEELTAHDYM